jgi:phospholipid transport system substrate-binding protein
MLFRAEAALPVAMVVMSLNRILTSLAAILMLAMSLGGQAMADTKCEAASFIRSAAQAYDRAASSGSASAFASAAARYSDLRSLSLFALGRYRKDLPKSREAEYLKLTRQFIGQTLKNHGSGLRGASLEILECKSSGGNTVVTARTSGGTKVVFRLARAGGGYTVRDLNMRGVWLIQQMRSTFVSTINRTGSIDGLFDYLRS